MATRPVFYVNENNEWESLDIEFEWYPGFALSQKQKSIQSFHSSISKLEGFKNILEISSKSINDYGRKLSAFSLEVQFGKIKKPVEVFFQSSKVFESGGPYLDILEMDPIDAKRDDRLKNSGNILCFEFMGEIWPNEPKTFFYDWLYINAVYQNPILHNELIKYRYFTDIEFNPKKSINCQAKSAALYVSLFLKGLLDKAISNKDFFSKQYIRYQDFYKQISLF